MLKYETTIPLEDNAKLQAEVTDIWHSFRIDCDRAKIASAIVSANEVPSGRFITRNRSFNFVFTKSSDGTWEQLKSPQ